MIRHYPVMHQNVLHKIKQLNLSRVFKVADCNFGFGGHSHLLLKNFPNCIIQGFDMDPKVLQYYYENYHSQLSQDCKKRLAITNSNYTCLKDQNMFDQYDIVLADLGFNTFHLQKDRGFSWLKQQNLDMRYNEAYQSCRSLIQRSSIVEIKQILQKNSDLKESKHVAETIFKSKPINTTEQLKNCIVGCFQKDKQKKIAQVFQAFRIATNRELQDLQNLCDILDTRLSNKGTAMIITFQSIQRDKIMYKIKNKQKMYSRIDIQEPTQQQISQNSKSKSAKMLTFNKK